MKHKCLRTCRLYAHAHIRIKLIAKAERQTHASYKQKIGGRDCCAFVFTCALAPPLSPLCV